MITKKEYILKNITKHDINLSDLRIKISANKSLNLLSKTGRKNIDEVLMSEKNGSISRYLKKGFLIKICKKEDPNISKIIMDKTIKPIVFPQRIKSHIVMEMSAIDEEIKNIILNEDEEYLKQLDNSNSDSLKKKSDNVGLNEDNVPVSLNK
jgi:hypothetical protein